MSRSVRTQLLLLFVVSVLVTIFSSNAAALPVRLRGELAPPCSVGSGNANWKYADIFADGNIAVQGSYNCRGAFIYDISNPDHPVLANWYNPGNNRQFLEAIVVGNRGYFGSGNGGGVYIVDLTNPYSPVLLGTVDASHGNGFTSIHEMVVFGNYLIENYNCLGCDKTLRIINISNPAAPVFVRSLTPTEPVWVHAMVVKGNRLFTSGWGNGTSARGRTEIYDISNIETQAPTLLGYVEDPSANMDAGNQMHSAWPSEDGNWLYSCREVTQSNGPTPGDLRVYDIHDPAHPLLVNSVGMTQLGINAVTPHNPVVHGNYLYISWYQAGLLIFNISNPANPTRAGSYDTFPGAFAPPPREKEALLDSEPWDLICASGSLDSLLPTTYDGAWAVYPNLGGNKVLVGDLARGLIVLDTTLIGSPTRYQSAAHDGRGVNVSIAPTSGDWQFADQSKMANLRRPGDIVVTGDYDGDGTSDFAVFRPTTGVWYMQESTGGLASVRFGTNGDIPVPADFDADGKTDIAVWRPSTGMWYIQQSIVGFRSQQWGTNGDRPMTGDYDGDGKADVAVWRPSNGMWYILPSTAAIPVYQAFGQAGDRPVNVDLDGDGVSDYAVYRPSNGMWYVLDPSTRNFNAVQFGTSEDVPVAMDYDGDGRDDIAVYRPSTNYRYGLGSSDGTFFSEALQRAEAPATLAENRPR